MGTFYKGGTKTYRSFMENLELISIVYPINTSGYFGEIGKSNSVAIRQIFSDDPVKEAQSFYEKLSFGGIEENLPNGKGKKTTLRDGTIIVYREKTSTPDSPAVEINVRYSKEHGKIKSQKIHFERKK